MSALILVVDDEDNIRTILAAIFESEGYRVLKAKNLFEAKSALRESPVEVLLTDLKLEKEDGLSLLKWVKEERLLIPTIILTAFATVDSAVDAMKQGAFDYVSKPFDRVELLSVIRKAVMTFKYQSNNSVRTLGMAASLPFIGNTSKMQKIYSIVEKVAPTDTTVIITGESGTGKELIAEALHEKSNRSKGPFIKINCAAIPETLMESELFGYEKGAFTGASGSKPGRFELADGGTLFLDEIGEMTVEMQVKLLRVLQERSFERVGGLRTINVDVRLITATNRDLEFEVKEGRFRQDLYYRLNVVPVALPPLRKRPDDIPALISIFAKKFSEKLKKQIPVINPEVLELLIQFPWPGNIRQLENVMERMVVMSDGRPVTPDQLPDDILDFEEMNFMEKQKNQGTLKEMVKDATRKIEKKAIEETLLETANNVTQAARKLNISRKGLQIKMKELGLR